MSATADEVQGLPKEDSIEDGLTDTSSSVSEEEIHVKPETAGTATTSTTKDKPNPPREAVSWKLLVGVGAVMLITAIAVILVKNKKEHPRGIINKSTETATTENGYFNSSFSLWGENVTSPYEGVDDLKADLDNAARFLLNLGVLRNLQVPGFENVALEPYFWCGDVQESGGGGGAAGQSGSNGNHYHTNNHEVNVTDGDRIVSDGQLGKLLADCVYESSCWRPTLTSTYFSQCMPLLKTAFSYGTREPASSLRGPP